MGSAKKVSTLSTSLLGGAVHVYKDNFNFRNGYVSRPVLVFML